MTRVHKYNSKDLRGLPTHTNSFTDISTFSGSSVSFALDDWVKAFKK